jgi:hypothetical protein
MVEWFVGKRVGNNWYEAFGVTTHEELIF